jgi:hypothetical protein
MADIQMILCKAISDPAFCDQPAASPEVTLWEAGVDPFMRESCGINRWVLLDTPPIVSRRTVELALENAGEARFDVSTRAVQLIPDSCDSGFQNIEALRVFGSPHRSRL